MVIRRFLLLLGVTVFLLSTGARAQLRNSDAFLGYSRLGNDVYYPNVGGLNGFDAALHIHIAPFLGAEGDYSYYGLGADSSIPKTSTFMAGPRLTLKVPITGIRIFGHGLVGGAHSSNSGGGVSINETTGTYALGGGVDIRVFPFFAWRFAGDHISRFTDSPSTAQRWRFNTGLVFRF
jgi:hypothetical protein